MSVTDHYTLSLARRTAILNAVAPDLDTSPGSDLYDELRADAAGSALVLYALDNVQQQASASTATGSNLDALGADAGLKRNQAAYATGSVTVNGASGAPAGGWLVPVNTRFLTAADANGTTITFLATAQTVVAGSGSASVPVQALLAGAAGNIASGAIASMDSVPGVTYSTSAAMTGGADAETDAAFRGRILASKTVLYSAAAVQAAALTVAGVAFSYLNDPKNGSGSTTCYAAASDGSLSGSLQTAVQTAVNAVLPLTETCTISAFGLVHAVIQASVAVQSGYTSNVVAANVASAIEAFMLTLGAGATLQPFAISNYLQANVLGLADFYLTSSIPTVGSTALLRLLAVPGASTLGTATTGGALSNGSYYVQVTWTTAAGETLPSAEQTITLSGGTSTQTITVTIPAFPDSVVTGASVYIASTSGGEKKQGTVSSSGGTYTQSGALSTGTAAPPASNTLTVPTITVVTV